VFDYERWVCRAGAPMRGIHTRICTTHVTSAISMSCASIVAASSGSAGGVRSCDGCSDAKAYSDTSVSPGRVGECGSLPGASLPGRRDGGREGSGRSIDKVEFEMLPMGESPRCESVPGMADASVSVLSVQAVRQGRSGCAVQSGHLPAQAWARARNLLRPPTGCPPP
jgi:hypothetical protein